MKTWRRPEKEGRNVVKNSFEVVFVGMEKLSFLLHFSCDAATRFLGFVLPVQGVTEAQHLFASSFIF